jgi:hypothetical protein
MSLTVAPETIEWFDYAELGEVEQTITPHQRGRVRFMATSWFARFYQPNGQTEALLGTTVRVIGRQGLTLLVMPVDEDGIQPQMVRGDSLSETLRERAEAHQSEGLSFFQWMGFVFGNLLN